MPYIEISLLNPINVVDINRSLPPNYHWRHFDAWTSFEQQTYFEKAMVKPQKWERGDIVFLQVKSDYSPIRLRLRDVTGKAVLNQVMSQVAIINSVVYYQDQVALDTFVTPEGYYLLEILGGDPIVQVLQAEVWDVRTSHPGSLLVKYWSTYNNTILYETGIYFNLRIGGGGVPYDSPGSVRTVYIDQPGSARIVKGDSFRNFTLVIGTDAGETNNIVDKLDEILNQTNVEFDGKGFAPVSGAAWERKKIDRYPYTQWSIALRETNNRREKRFEVAAGLQEQKVIIDYNVEGKLFGPLAGAANDNTYVISKVD